MKGVPQSQTRRPTARFEELSDADRTASLQAMLAERPDSGEIWVFAYGSLIWRPCFEYAERLKATLAGYRRRFSVWTVIARGTPATPGLALALEEGGGPCRGVAFRLSPSHALAGLESLWARELLTTIYRPRWLTVTVEGRAVTAISFVVKKADAQYAGALPAAEQAAIIAAAQGKLGSCRDYLANTVAELVALGIDEPWMTALLQEVDAIAARTTRQNAPEP
jgi:cation transport protein ChaC